MHAVLAYGISNAALSVFPNSLLWVFRSVGVHGEHTHLTKFQTKSK